MKTQEQWNQNLLDTVKTGGAVQAVIEGIRAELGDNGVEAALDARDWIGGYTALHMAIFVGNIDRGRR